ncbi:MAG: alpha/beta hydrolase [Phycisphaerae bacterium]|nr:alpha/beta hydrolase [Phycisphaerae bacterium]
MNWRPLLLVAATFALSGCGYIHYRAENSPPTEHSPPPRWPTTWTDSMPALRTPIGSAAPETFSSRRSSYSPPDNPRDLVSVPIGAGLVTYVSPSLAQGPPSTDISFDFFAWRERPPALDALHLSPESAEAASLYALTASAPLHMEFRLWLPSERPARGLVLYQWGLSGYKYEKELVRILTERGWAVLGHNGLAWRRPGALTVSPDAPAAQPPKPADGISVRRRPMKEERPDERTRRTYLDATAALAATDFDDAIGLYALANESALRFVYERFPAIPHSPLIIVGCSFGAIMSPSVSARLDEVGLPAEAVILIGGGTNFLEVAGSEWMDYYYSRVRGRVSTELHLTVAERKIVTAEYIRRSTLDPYHTAPLLRDKHMLIMHASWDAIVPAAKGEELWERAGRPERWVGNFGHLYMFATLSWAADDIVAWIDRRFPDTGTKDGR